MIKNLFQILLLISFVEVSFSQENKSIHQIEYEKFFSLQKTNSEENHIIEEISPLNTAIHKSLSKAVFGYYPYWEYSNNAHINFRYDLLTHIALFDFSVSNTGAISNPPNWPWTNLINTAHQNGVKVIMVLVNFNANDIHNLITNSTAKWVFISNVKNKIANYNFDGVNVDFEGLKLEDRGSLINNFMKELTDSVHSTFPGKEVSYAAPAVNWGGWDLKGLANSCDYLFIMGYDFYGSWSNTTGPTAPLVSGTSYNITNTVNIQYGEVTKNSPEKLILGVPYYGPHWKTVNSNEESSILEYVEAVRFRAAQPNSESYGLKWSTKFMNSWYSYIDNSFYNHQVWFDNDESLELKYDLAISKNLMGVGMWALGYDGTRNELWNLLEKKFGNPVNVEFANEIPNEIILYQNYPNPFNPTTNISYTIPITEEKFSSSTRVVLKVYDSLGKEISTLVNDYKAPGNYSVQFDASSIVLQHTETKTISSGIYFYRLSVGNSNITKRMILLR